MVTRSRVGTTHPNPHYVGHVSTISPLPRSYKEAFNDPNWRNAMFDEYNALIKNKTWTSVSRPECANIVHCMRLFRHKFLADGTLSRYKARLVANGSTQVEGVDVDETFSLVVKSGTIRTVPRLAISRHWPVHQLDRKYAMEILERAHMVGCNPSRTPVDNESILGDGGTPQVCLYMHDPWEPHFSALKRILRAEAEYRGVANVVAETCWIQNLLRELHTPLSSATIVYCDNVSVVYLSSNPVQHQRTKHIEIDIHFVRDLVATGINKSLEKKGKEFIRDRLTKCLCFGLNNEIVIKATQSCKEGEASTKSTTTPSYDFLDDSTDLISTLICTTPITHVPASVHTPQVDVPTPPTPPIPPPPPTPQSMPQIVPKHAPAPTNDSPTVSIHPMVTRSRIETTHPNPCYAGHVSTISPLTWSSKEAFNDPNWQNAMFDEYNALIKNKT
uniref:Ribonuclease H-like domain-containing protein n=1 Tax=Tanacetum cinerariifolium TaxID=118510 RepID=A0A6L2N644_TANCI|nr:ribonuclease H-like domain-containing protein [Tanacetum cinerariifolium]